MQKTRKEAEINSVMFSYVRNQRRFYKISSIVGTQLSDIGK